MKVSDHPVATIHPPCPEWCHSHHDSDEAVARGAITSIYRLHYGPETQLICRDPDSGNLRQPVVLRAERYDPDHELGPAAICLLTVDDDGRRVELMDVTLGLESAEQLAGALVDAVALARGGPR